MDDRQRKAAAPAKVLRQSNEHPDYIKPEDGNSTAAQRSRVLAWLLTKGPLTTLQAREELDVMHPAGRVMELRGTGWDIRTHRRYDCTRDGKRHRVGEYVLLSGRAVA